MRRPLCLVLLGAAIALPLPAAVACTAALPMLDVDRKVVTPGSVLRVAGSDIPGEQACVTPVPPTEDPTPSPSQSPSPTPSPLLPTELPTPFVPGPAFYRSDRTVEIAIRTSKEFGNYVVGGGRTIARVAPRPPVRLDAERTRHSFAADVRLPANLAPGRYVLDAGEQDVAFYGYAFITVVAQLPETGAPVADLVRVGVAALVCGAGALVAARRRGVPPPD